MSAAMMKNLTVLLAMTSLALWLAVVQARAGEINLSAAASMKDTLTAIADRFVTSHPGVIIRKNFGASGALAKQIENGAPADIYISANQQWLSYLLEKGLLEQGSTAILASNTLVFVGRAQTQAASLAEVAQLQRVAIGSPKSVPAGDYAMQALAKMGMAKAMAGKLVMAKDVRGALLYAERGEVDGAFVYRTDALLAKDVGILFTVPRELHPPITYPLGLTLTGAKNEEARQLMHYLLSAEATGVLRRYGFAPP
jgi:molybdate transport system substrate-binding protein